MTTGSPQTSVSAHRHICCCVTKHFFEDGFWNVFNCVHQFCDGFWLDSEILFWMYSQIQNLRTFRYVSPNRSDRQEMTRPRNFSTRKLMLALVVWLVAPSCMNQYSGIWVDLICTWLPAKCGLSAKLDGLWSSILVDYPVSTAPLASFHPQQLTTPSPYCPPVSCTPFPQNLSNPNLSGRQTLWWKLSTAAWASWKRIWNKFKSPAA